MTSAALIRRRRSSASLLSLYSALGIRPELAFDFANERYFTSRVPTTFSDAITHTRASTATYVDSSGVLQTAASGEPRVGHHVWDGSAWVNEGLLHESEARTNVFTYNKLDDAALQSTSQTLGTFVQIDGSAQGITAEVVATGLESGIPYLDWQISGTENGTGTAFIDITDTDSFSASPGDQATVSGYFKLVSGSVPSDDYIQLYFHWRDAANVLLSGPGLQIGSDVGGSFERFHFTATAPANTTQIVNKGMLIRVPQGATVNFTVRVALLQVELAATPSSPILTSGSAVTRAADVLTIPSANLPWPSPVVIGSELITNGDFSNGTTGWTSNFGATLSISNGALRVEEDGVDAAGARASQIITTEIGKVYQVSVDLVDTNDDYEVYISNSTAFGGALASSTGLTAPQTIELFFVATSTSTYVLLGAGSTVVGTYCEYDNISVREIDPLAVSIQMDGAINYSDEGVAAQQTFLRWQLDANNYISVDLDTDSTATGEVNFNQAASGTVDTVATAGNALSPSIATAFNIASRHGSTFINGAVDGTALTENTTPVALPNLSASNLSLGNDYMGTIKQLRVWANDIGDTGIEEAST